jgi:hypothetical protein
MARRGRRAARRDEGGADCAGQDSRPIARRGHRPRRGRARPGDADDDEHDDQGEAMSIASAAHAASRAMPAGASAGARHVSTVGHGAGFHSPPTTRAPPMRATERKQHEGQAEHRIVEPQRSASRINGGTGEDRSMRRPRGDDDPSGETAEQRDPTAPGRRGGERHRRHSVRKVTSCRDLRRPETDRGGSAVGAPRRRR